MAKIGTGALVFHLEALELGPIVEQVIAANHAYGVQYDVEFDLRETLPGVRVNVDRDRLIQVLTNLLSNAAKFSPPGSAVIVTLTRHQDMIRTTVIDRGSGIPAELCDRIFEKFVQADSSNTRRQGGTGLGLSIAKAIVTRLGGQIGFTTEVGSGTSFYVDLPEYRA
jgi:signal transduction histidine kinase